MLRDPNARALYLFPTKALSADQVTELYDMIGDLDCDIKAFTYDGDTAVSARRAVRRRIRCGWHRIESPVSVRFPACGYRG